MDSRMDLRRPATRIAGSIGDLGTRGDRTDSVQSSNLGLFGTGESYGIVGVGAANAGESARVARTNEEEAILILKVKVGGQDRGLGVGQ
jgi:hypothetical protein